MFTCTREVLLWVGFARIHAQLLKTTLHHALDRQYEHKMRVHAANIVPVNRRPSSVPNTLTTTSHTCQGARVGLHSRPGAAKLDCPLETLQGSFFSIISSPSLSACRHRKVP